MPSRLCALLPGDTYVIKTIGIQILSRKEQEDALREVQLLAAVDHPRVVSYFDSFYEVRCPCFHGVSVTAIPLMRCP